MNKIGIIIVLISSFLVTNCSNKKRTFFDLYKEFRITTWHGEKFVSEKRNLTQNEKEKLKKLLDNANIVYKDTLNSIYIKNDEFYDDPQLLLSSFTDFLLDSALYERRVRFIDSIKTLNSLSP